MFPLRRGTSFYGVPFGARPLEAWRGAARLVWARWEVFLDAPPEVRGRAYAAYLAALDAEAAAAADIAGLPSASGA
jgi:hypothetical protein